MTRISLVDAYDNRDVIVQIENLKKGKQDKLNAGTGVTIEGNTINVDTSDLATKGELTSETARLDQKIDDVDAKIPPLASKEELNAQTARLDQKIDDVDNKIPPLASKAELADVEARLDAEIEVVDAKIPPLASKEELNQQVTRLDARVDAVDAKIPPLASKTELTAEVTRLDTRIDDVDAKIPPLASKAELADEVSRLDTKIETGDRDLSSRIDASNVKIKTNADAIQNIEDELGSDALPGTIYYRISKVEGDVITLKPLVNDSIKKVDVEGDASTVYHKALHNSGIVENDALPVASDTKAGIMSAGMYVGFNGSIQNLQARMAVLEGVGITYQLTGLPDNATSEQITEAFQAQYPNVPLMAGIRAADYDKAKIWQYSGTSWIQLTSININTATSTSLGVVKGSVTSDTNEGKIFVEVDGTMAVIGWDTLKALVTATKQSVDNLEPKVTQQSAKIDALEDNVAANASDITTLQGTSSNHESRITSLETTSASLGTRMSAAETDIDNLQASDSQQTTKITTLEGSSANHESRISSLETTSTDLGTRMSSAETDIETLQSSDAQQTSKISSLETTSASLSTRIGTAETDIDNLQTSDAQQTSKISALETTSADLRTRMGTAEHDIDTLQASDAQHTTKISALEADMNNVKPRVGQLESDVGTLKTDVNGLKTSKQDKLIAGNGISIASDGKTISSSGGGQWMNHTSENIDDIIEFQIYDYLDVTGRNSAKITVHKDLKFCIYIAHGPKSKSKSLMYNELELPKGVYQINYDTTGLILMDNTGNRYSNTFIRLTRAYISITKYSNHNELKIGIGFEYNNGTTNVSSGNQINLSNNSPAANAEHPIRVLPDVINAKTLATAVGISNEDYSNKDIISGVLIKYYEGV